MRLISIFFTLMLTILTSSAHASGRSIECRNEAQSPITASININQDQATIKFGEESDASQLEDDLLNKSVKLSLSSESSNNGYLQFEGKTPVRGSNSEIRSIQIRVLAELLQSDEDFHMIFNISTRHSKDLSALSFWSYGMICR